MNFRDLWLGVLALGCLLSFGCSRKSESSAGISMVATVGALKSISVAALQEGQQFQVAGYHVPGDGAGGLFRFQPSSTEKENGGTVIAPETGQGRWLRVFSGELNARWFGARGNDSSDDTLALQAAIDAARGATTLYIPAGKYRAKRSLNATGAAYPPIYRDWIRIRGDSFMSTTITGEEAGYPVLDMLGCAKSVLEDITVNAAGDGPTCAILIGRPKGDPSSGDHSFTRVRTVGNATKAGFFSLSSEVNAFRDCIFTCDNPVNPMISFILADSAEKYGILSKYLTVGAGAGGNGLNSFYNCRFTTYPRNAPNGREGACLVIDGAYNVTMLNCYFWSKVVGQQIVIRGTLFGWFATGLWQETNDINDAQPTPQPIGVLLESAAFMRDANLAGSIFPIVGKAGSYITNSTFANVCWQNVNPDRVVMDVDRILDSYVSWGLEIVGHEMEKAPIFRVNTDSSRSYFRTPPVGAGAKNTLGMLYRGAGPPTIPDPKTGDIYVRTDGALGSTVLAFEKGAFGSLATYLSGTSDWTPPKVERGESTLVLVTVIGAKVGQTCSVGFTSPLPATAFLTADVVGDGVVAVKLVNFGASSLALPAGRLRVNVMRNE